MAPSDVLLATRIVSDTTIDAHQQGARKMVKQDVVPRDWLKAVIEREDKQQRQTCPHASCLIGGNDRERADPMLSFTTRQNLTVTRLNNSATQTKPWHASIHTFEQERSRHMLYRMPDRRRNVVYSEGKWRIKRGYSSVSTARKS